MNTVAITTITALLFMIEVVHIECRPTSHKSTSTNKIQACGRELADILQATCLFGYNTYYKKDEYEKSSNGRRKKRGITQECCFQSCTHEELSEYCYDGSSVNATVLRQKWPELFAEDSDSVTASTKNNNIDEPTPNENTETDFSNNEIIFQSLKNNIQTATQKPRPSVFVPPISRISTVPSPTTKINITIKKTKPYYTKPPVILVIERKFDWKG